MCAAYGRLHGDLLCALYAHAWSESRVFPPVERSPLPNSPITGAAPNALALTTAVDAGLYWAALARGIATEEARAMAFLALVTANAVRIFASRSPHPGWHGMFTGQSQLALWVLLGTLVAVTVIITVLPAAATFGFAPPSVANWLLAVGVATLVLFIATKVVMPVAKK
nr:cation transporting ATPase C-terminal domain-containing protein [Rhodocyclus gracilis]